MDGRHCVHDREDVRVGGENVPGGAAVAECDAAGFQNCREAVNRTQRPDINRTTLLSRMKKFGIYAKQFGCRSLPG